MGIQANQRDHGFGHVRQSRGMGVAFCRVYVFPFGLVFIGMWTAFSSVLCFLADHSSRILGLYIVSLLLRLGRMGMLLRGVCEVSLDRGAALADT
ncbi:unnamed protein product [Prunus armeniaca]